MTIFDWIVLSLGVVVLIRDIAKWVMTINDPLFEIGVSLGTVEFFDVGTLLWLSCFLFVAYRAWG